MKLLAFIFTFFLSITIMDTMQAAHIVGGEAHYTFIRFNTDSTQVMFEVEFIMYRDNVSQGADFDDPAQFGIYELQRDGSWDFIDQISERPGMVNPIIPPDDPCVDEPTDEVGVESTNYVFEYTFDINGRDYLIAYQRCCRNNTINNIRDPGDTGAVFDIIISNEAQVRGNSSPQFQNFPPIFICQGIDLVFDHSAADADPEGDELRYTFCAPFESGGVVDVAMGGNLGCCQCVRPNPAACRPNYGNVVFVPPFTAQRPLEGDPVVSIDPITGLIEGRPQTLGQFVVGVCVEEFRDGVLLSTVRRDFQFNVLQCTPVVFADFALEIIDDNVMTGLGDCTAFAINSCGENTITIINDSQQEANIQTYHWTFFNEDGSILDDVEGGPEVRDLDVTFPGIGRYTGSMILNEGTICSDTACFFVNIFPSIEADYSFDFDTCVAGPVDFEDLSVTGAIGGITEWSWQLNNQEFSDSQNPNFQFPQPGILPVSLIVTDENECTDAFLMNVDYRPAPQEIIVEPSTFVGCSPSEIFFDNLSEPIDSTYDILWDFGDGNTSTEISPTHIYQEPGVFTVNLDIVSPIGCEIARDFPSFIRVLEGPTADFAFSPDEPNNFNSEVQFTDLSTNVDRWLWDFGGVGSSSVRNPSFDFPDTGVFEVKLTSFHPITSCPDTITRIVDIRPIVMLFLPNAFTPNNDAKNDFFIGNGVLDGLFDYNMTIWNRWGENIYDTTNPRAGWNGKKNNNGEDSPQGVYVYRVSYTTPRGEREVQEGHVTLLR
jgi:gliding motility-associated-like protein